MSWKRMKVQLRRRRRERGCVGTSSHGPHALWDLIGEDAQTAKSVVGGAQVVDSNPHSASQGPVPCSTADCRTTNVCLDSDFLLPGFIMIVCCLRLVYCGGS